GQNKRDPSFESWNAPSWDNPRLDRNLIEQQRLLLPERVFRTEFGGEFVEGSGAVFRGVREAATGSLSPPDPEARYWAGLDLARVEDYSVLTIVSENDGKIEVVYFDRFHRIDWSIQVARISTALANYNEPKLLLDSTGIGDPIHQSLRASGCRAFP